MANSSKKLAYPKSGSEEDMVHQWLSTECTDEYSDKAWESYRNAKCSDITYATFLKYMESFNATYGEQIEALQKELSVTK